MQTKKAREALVGAPRPPLPPAWDARARLRLHNLMQDYEELLKETAAKRRRLQMERQRVVRLTDEVKFLRRRYKFLIKNSRPTAYMAKTHSQRAPTAMRHKARKVPAAFNTQHKSGEFVQRGQHVQHDSSYGAKEVSASTSLFLDLNRISLPDEEDGEFHVAWASMPMENSLKRYLSDGDVPGSEPKSSLCHDIGSGTKRKISRQDQVVLKV